MDIHHGGRFHGDEGRGDSMMDFTGVQAITIPEGPVAKIMRGSEVLWEKPSAAGIVNSGGEDL